jgi:predicted ester cyclase
MNILTTEGTQLIERYFEALSGKPKTEEVIGEFVSDAALKEHIRQAEAAFPAYQLVADQLVSEGNIVAVRGRFQGTHLGPFAGIAPTGKEVSADVMLFYQLDHGKIVKHWMVLDMMALMSQLNS